MTDLENSQIFFGSNRLESTLKDKRNSFHIQLGEYLGIIQDAEEEDEKESQKHNFQENQELIMSNDTFHARSPHRKKQKNDHLNKAQGEQELKEILKQRKLKKSVSLEEINRASNDDCDIMMTEDMKGEPGLVNFET